jgi:hypothetical protein
MLLGTSLLRGHTLVAIVLEMMAAAKDTLCQMTTMMTMPLMMPFVWGVLFSMCLVNLQETQVVCQKAHPCLDGHTMVAIVLETLKVPALAITIKAVGRLNSCFLLLDLGFHLSFQRPKKLEAALMVDMPVLLALLPPETMTALHLVHHTNTA